MKQLVLSPAKGRAGSYLLSCSPLSLGLLSGMTSVVSQGKVVSLLSQSSCVGEVDFVQVKCPHDTSSLYRLHIQADFVCQNLRNLTNHMSPSAEMSLACDSQAKKIK